MNTFERNRDPKKSLGIGLRELYYKLKVDSIIKLVNNEDFDPTIDVRPGELLLIHEVDENPYSRPGETIEKGTRDFHYHVIDEQLNIEERRSDTWLMTPDFFAECFTIEKL